MRRMYKYGLLEEQQNKLDYVLALTPTDFLERRLQTLVFKLGLAKSIHHARVLIRQRHIRCGSVITHAIRCAPALLAWPPVRLRHCVRGACHCAGLIPGSPNQMPLTNIRSSESRSSCWTGLLTKCSQRFWVCHDGGWQSNCLSCGCRCNPSLRKQCCAVTRLWATNWSSPRCYMHEVPATSKPMADTAPAGVPQGGQADRERAVVHGARGQPEAHRLRAEQSVRRRPAGPQQAPQPEVRLSPYSRLQPVCRY